MTDYTAPELTETERIQAQMDAMKLVRRIGVQRLQIAFCNLAAENVRLVKQINDLRAKLDIEPLQTYEVK
jgi:hypothetical protein